MLDDEKLMQLSDELRTMIFAMLDQFYANNLPEKDPGAAICMINGVIISDLIFMTLKVTLKGNTKLADKVSFLEAVLKTTKKKIIEDHKRVN